METQKTVVLIGGPNGAGKTTSSRTVLRRVLQNVPFVNADHIAQGLGGANVEGSAIEAGRIMLDRLGQLAASGQSFALESTLASKSLASHAVQWKADGYKVLLFYFWLESPELAVARVAQRVAQGGHDIPCDTIVRRYTRSMSNFREIYRPIADFWSVYDNTSMGRSASIARGQREVVERVFDPATWLRFSEIQ